MDIVAGFASIPHCFTLQCCYGHFVRHPGIDEHTLEPLADRFAGTVRYRIAYVAFCIENSRRGRALRDSLARMVEIDPGFVQFGSPDWFWERWANSYALQVEPFAHRHGDEAALGASDALHTQRIRDRFFRELRKLLASEMRAHASG